MLGPTVFCLFFTFVYRGPYTVAYWYCQHGQPTTAFDGLLASMERHQNVFLLLLL